MEIPDRPRKTETKKEIKKEQEELTGIQKTMMAILKQFANLAQAASDIPPIKQEPEDSNIIDSTCEVVSPESKESENIN